jgi:hypothetical protein
MDQSNRQPTPVRISIADPDGNYLFPFGRFADFPTAKGELVGGYLLGEEGEKSFYIDGRCEIPLPTGIPLRVVISKGFAEIRETVTLGSGQLTLRFEIRCDPLPNADWICGDSRVHFVDPYVALLEAEAEGVNVTQLLATELDFASQSGHVYRAVPNLESFSGTASRLERTHSVIAVNTLNTHPVLGRVGLLNSHRPIFPLTFGDMEESDDWSVCDWCDQCHRKTGLVSWCDPFSADSEFSGGEALIAAILGKIDAFEVSNLTRIHSILDRYYSLLNAGVRIPLIGGSGKNSNRTAVGAIRTWIRERTGSPLPDWIEGVRRGEGSISTGFPIDFQVNDRPPGTVIQLNEPDEPIRICSQHHPSSGRHQLIANGTVIRDLHESATEIHLPGGGWICTRILGEGRNFAHSSPVYIEPLDRKRFCVPKAMPFLMKHIESTREWVRTVGRFDREKSREHLLQHADRAEAILRERLASAGV